MRTIEVDFDVFKALTLRRPAESVSENDVLRELLGLPTQRQSVAIAAGPAPGDWVSKGVRFPAGTEFKATYKGKTYLGRVEGAALVLNGERFAGQVDLDCVLRIVGDLSAGDAQRAVEAVVDQV